MLVIYIVVFSAFFFSSSFTVDGIFVYDFHRSLFGYDFYYFVSCLLLIYGINEIHS